MINKDNKIPAFSPVISKRNKDSKNLINCFFEIKYICSKDNIGVKESLKFQRLSYKMPSV